VSALGTVTSTTAGHARHAGRPVTGKSVPASPHDRRGKIGIATTVIAPQNVTGAVHGRLRRPAGNRPRPRAVHRVTTATATVASAVNEVSEASAETEAKHRRAATRRRVRATKAAVRNKAVAPATEDGEGAWSAWLATHWQIRPT
jgi:hypothetical protein